MNKLRILLVDDEAAVRRGLSMRLKLEPDLEVVGEAENGLAAVELFARLSPDVVLMDVQMPGIDGIEATRRIIAAYPAARVLITMRDDIPTREAALRAGAIGFLGKNCLDDRLVPTLQSLTAPPEAAGRGPA